MRLRRPVVAGERRARRRVETGICIMEKKEKRPGLRSVMFELKDAPGRQVFVAGSFNNWQPAHRLTDKDGAGVYRCRVMLLPGDYEYKFVVDGEWRLDAANPNFAPNDFGTLNSLLTVAVKK